MQNTRHKKKNFKVKLDDSHNFEYKKSQNLNPRFQYTPDKRLNAVTISKFIIDVDKI